MKAKELFPRNKPSPVYGGYSFEDLALIFDRTRAAIVEAVKQKRKEAKIMLEEATLRCASGQPSLEELTDDEKRILVQKNDEKSGNSLTC